MSEPSPPAGGRPPDEPASAAGRSRPPDNLTPERIEAAIAAAEARSAQPGEAAAPGRRHSRKQRRAAGTMLALVALAAIAAAAVYAYDLAGRPAFLPWAGEDAADGVAPQGPGRDGGEGGLTEEQLREMEELLARLAFRPGPVDGVVDARTEAAISAFQRTAGLTVDGEPSARLLRELRAVVAPLADEG